MLSIMINNQPYICHLSNVMIQSKWKIPFKNLNIKSSTNLSLNPKLSKIAYSTQEGSVHLCSLYNQSFNLNFNSNESTNFNNDNQIQIFESGSEVVHLFWLNDFSQLCAIKRGGELFLWNCDDNSSFKTLITDLADVDSLQFDSLTKTLLCINGKRLINISFCTLDPPLCLTSSSLYSILSGKMVASIHKKSNSQFDEVVSLPPEIFPISKAAESSKSDLAIYGGNRLVVITENKLFLTTLSNLTAMCWCNQKLFAFCTSNKEKSRLSSSNLTIFNKELTKIGSISSPHMASTVSASPENDRIVISNRHYLTIFDFDPARSIKKPPSAKFQESHIGWEEFSLTITTFTIPEPIINAVCGLNDDIWLHLKTKTSAGSCTESYNFEYIKKINKNSEKNDTKQTKTKNQTNLNKTNKNIENHDKENITSKENINNSSDNETKNKNDKNINSKDNENTNNEKENNNNDNDNENNINYDDYDENKQKINNNNDNLNNGGDDDEFNDYDNLIVSFPSFDVIETNADKMWSQARLDLLFIEKSNTVKIFCFSKSQLFLFEISHTLSTDENITHNKVERKSDKPLCSMRTDFIFLNTNQLFGTFPFTTIDFAFRIMQDELQTNTNRCFVFAKSLVKLADFNKIMSHLCVFSLQKGKIAEFIELMKMFGSKETISILSSFDKSILAVLASTFSIDNDNDFFEISEIFCSFDNDSQIQILTTTSPSEFIKIINNKEYKRQFFKNDKIHYLSKIVDSLILSMEWSKLQRFCKALLDDQIEIDLPSKLMSFSELGALQFDQTLRIIQKDNFKWKDVKIENSTFSMDQSNQKELLKNLGFAFTAADFGQWAAACFSVTGDENKCKFIFLDKPEIIKDVDKFINDTDNVSQEQMITFLRSIIDGIKKSDI